MSHIHSSSSSTATTTCVQDTKIRTHQNENPNTLVRILKLSPPKMVTWTENTIDNENAHKKSSKACCIYHKPKNFGESSDSDSDFDSDSDHSECDNKGCHSFSKKEKKKSKQISKEKE
ncbi:protein phosphatase inhibitor 3, putative [Hepatocystis sp. ex Piliocolobus tephrosceles]|nr:protein phosphatase inhibitor 3, putative [Hepatocystis sp. ex Piliocolobus tephrosceles]